MAAVEPITLRAGDTHSTIAVEAGGLETAGARIAARWPEAGRVFAISEERVWALFGARLAASCAAAGLRLSHRAAPEGEGSKSLAQAGELYAWLADERAERGEPIVALGGGVVGDLAGFVAATYLRGVPLAQIPTTLLAQVDSSVGGKTAVNLPAGKNLVGAFYQPALVLVDPALLGGLPPRQLASGWAEVIKYALIDGSVPGLGGDPLLPVLRDDGAALRALREPVTSTVIRRCIAIKAAVVARDERETGLRRILNLGHTIGHAVEAAAGYGRWTHGEAVALGLRGAGRLAVRRGLHDPSLQREVERLLDAYGLPGRIAGCTVEELLARIGGDKKVRGGRVNWVLPAGPGQVVVRDDVPEADVRAVLAELGAT